MHEFELFIALLGAILALVWLARPLRVAYPVVLVLGGLGIGLLPFVPDVQVDPDFVLLAFLPPILHRAAFQFAAEDVSRQWHVIALLAVGLVLATIGAVAFVAHAVVGIPWSAAFVLGAILGPTDPVAATSVFRRLGVPERLGTILEGESLVNDGSGITAFRIAVGVLGGEAFQPAGAALEFIGVAAGGLALGAAIGFAGTLVRRRLGAIELEITAGLVMAYGAFALAERLHLSGILAVVAAGFVVGRAGAYTDPETRVQATGFWQALAFVAECVLFALIGVAFAEALSGGEVAVGRLALDALLIAVTCVAVRLLWMYSVPYLVGRLDRSSEGWQPMTDRQERLLLGVSGMRGAVSVAAALAIPMSMDVRDELVLLTCGAVVLTLVPTAIALPWLVRRLGLSQDEEARRRYVDARVQVAHAALNRAEELAREERTPESLLQRAREAYQLRIARLQQSVGDGSADDGTADEYRRVRHELLDAEREALHELSDRNEVRGPALRRIRHELDLEETRLSR